MELESPLDFLIEKVQVELVNFTNDGYQGVQAISRMFDLDNLDDIQYSLSSIYTAFTGIVIMAKRKVNGYRFEWICQIIGWGLFILCAILFLASGIKNNDLLTIIGSVFFLIACFLFIYPLLTIAGKRKDADE